MSNTWPDHFDICNGGAVENRLLSFVRDEMSALENYNHKRSALTDGKHTYIFHEHAKRVAENVKRTCIYMQLGEHVAKNMYWAVLPHDIGKKMLPVEIWDQEEKPDEVLKTYRRTHTLLGAQIAQEILHDIEHPFKELMIDIMRHHHEQMDGKGTQNIDSAQLSKPVRLAAIVEAYDGWRIWRPHYGDRDISPEGVLTRMRNEKGANIFDMELFEAFAEMKMLDYKEGRLLQGI